MTQLKLNKSEMAHIQKGLSTYKQYLPALELRKQHLQLTRQKLLQAQGKLQNDAMALDKSIKKHMIMFSNPTFNLSSLISIADVIIVKENIAGVILPKLEVVYFNIEHYNPELTPNWMEAAIDYLKSKITLAINNKILKEREHLLHQAILKTSQRINLFEKVLIPQAEKDIRTIQIALSDQATSAVVRAKLCKKLASNQKR